MNESDIRTIVEQNHIIMDLLEVIDLLQAEMKKKDELIKKLEKSVQNTEKSREYWVKKYCSLQDEIIRKEQEEKMNTH